MSSSVHGRNRNIDGRNKNILVFGKRPTQGLDNATITAEAKHPINFTESRYRFVLSLHYYGSNSFLFVNTVKIGQLKSKIFRSKIFLLFLGNISNDSILDNMNKTGLKGICGLFLLTMTLIILAIY